MYSVCHKILFFTKREQDSSEERLPAGLEQEGEDLVTQVCRAGCQDQSQPLEALPAFTEV